MKRIALALAVLLIAVTASAQNQAPVFSSGPTIPLTKIAFKEDTQKWESSLLSAGAGYSFNFNFFPNWDGSIRRFTLGIPLFVNIPAQSQFNLAAGLTAGAINNLLSAGAYVDLVSTESQTGVLLGDFKKSNFGLLFSLGFNFGSGTPPAPETVNALQKAGMPVESKPPRGYLSW